MVGPLAPGSKPPKLLDRVRANMRLNRYSPRTEAAYIDWIKRFIRFHGVRHPQEMGAEEVKTFLGHLATEMNVAASTQNETRQCEISHRSGDFTGTTSLFIVRCVLSLPSWKSLWRAQLRKRLHGRC